MSKSISIEVFGIREESTGGCCAGGCGSGGCGPSKTMGEQFDELEQFLAGTELKEQIEIKFVDVMSDELEAYPSGKQALEKGLALPITVINGKARFYGGLSTKKIYTEINAIIKRK